MRKGIEPLILEALQFMGVLTINFYGHKISHLSPQVSG